MRIFHLSDYLGTEKKKLTDNENEVDGEIPDEQEEEDMDEYEVRKITNLLFKQVLGII